MIQQILLSIVFLTAVAYLIRLVIRQFRAESACTKGCGKCGALDIKAIEERFNADVRTP